MAAGGTSSLNCDYYTISHRWPGTHYIIIAFSCFWFWLNWNKWPRSKQCVVKSTASRKFPLYISLPIYLIYMGRGLRWESERGISQSLHDTCGEGNGTPLQCSCLENPMDGGAWWAAVRGVAKSRTRLNDFTFTFHFHALEKEMAAHSSVLAWRIPGMGEPGGLPSMGLHRVGYN